MVTVSNVRISNLALSRLGTNSTIESLSENSTEAIQSLLWYDFSRIQTLEAYDWSFARKRLTLALSSEDPPDGVWGYRYQYPSDCVMFRKIENPTRITLLDRRDFTANDLTDAVPFEIEVTSDGLMKTILTDMETAIGVYTSDQETTELFSIHFIQALSTLMAYHMCVALTGKLQLKEQLFQEWQKLILDAPAHDANERVGRPERDASWIRQRA